MTNYDTKWDLVSEKITKDVVFVPDSLKERRMVSPESPKSSRIAELRKHEVYAPPPIVNEAKTPVDLEIKTGK